MNSIEVEIPVKEMERTKERTHSRYIIWPQRGGELNQGDIFILEGRIKHAIEEIDDSQIHGYEFVEIEADVSGYKALGYRSQLGRIKIGRWEKGEEPHIDFAKIKGHNLKGIFIRFTRKEERIWKTSL